MTVWPTPEFGAKEWIAISDVQGCGRKTSNSSTIRTWIPWPVVTIGLRIYHPEAARFEFQIQRPLWQMTDAYHLVRYHTWSVGTLRGSVPLRVSKVIVVGSPLPHVVTPDDLGGRAIQLHSWAWHVKKEGQIEILGLHRLRCLGQVFLMPLHHLSARVIFRRARKTWKERSSLVQKCKGVGIGWRRMMLPAFILETHEMKTVAW